jgi:hypothetical protein
MPKIQFSAAGDSKAWSISLFLKKSNELLSGIANAQGY